MYMPRKTYFVNPRLQWRLVLGANVLALVSVAMISTLLFYAQARTGTFAAMLNLPRDHPYMAQIAASETQFLWLCIGIGIIQFALFNATAVFLSHRIAGPLYRLERHLEVVGGGGEPRDVRFRKGDLYQQLAESCNKVMARMRELAVVNAR